MALRTILTDESPTLRKISRKVERFDERLWILLDDMSETMEQAEGVGLAAPQLGILKRVALIDVGDGPIEIINPVITSSSGTQEMEEGCLSVPGMRGNTIRPKFVSIKAQDRHGREFTIDGEDLLAVALAHEIDHLEGKLYTDIVIGELWRIDE